MKLKTFISRLQNLEVPVTKAVDHVFFEERDAIESLIRERLSEGLNTDGSEIANEISTGPRIEAYSTRRYKERKEAGLQTNRIDLKETGRLYNSIKYRRGGKIEVTDDNSKVDKLENFFGGPDQLWGLSDNDAQFIADRNADIIAERVAQIITK